MKFFVLLVLFTILIFGRCRMVPDPVQQFVPGSYVRFSTHEFGSEYDTLIITVQNRSAHEYKIVRRWKYERVVEGQQLQVEYQKNESSVIYDPDHKLLEENKTGKIYSIDVKGNCLYNGPNKYQKL